MEKSASQEVGKLNNSYTSEDEHKILNELSRSAKELYRNLQYSWTE